MILERRHVEGERGGCLQEGDEKPHIHARAPSCKQKERERKEGGERKRERVVSEDFRVRQ